MIAERDGVRGIHTIVGSRIAKIEFDESSIFRAPFDGDDIESIFHAERSGARIAAGRFEERPVIEHDIAVRYDLRSAGPPEKRLTLFELRVTVGYVGWDPKDDGDLVMFEKYADDYSRLAYLQYSHFLRQSWGETIVGFAGHVPPGDVAPGLFRKGAGLDMVRREPQGTRSANKKKTKKAAK